MDDLRKKTDKELQKMEKKLAKIYKEAEKDLTKKWNEYMGRAEKRIEKYEKALSDAKQSGDKESIAQAEEELKRRREAVLYKDEWYRKMVEQTAEKYSDVNNIAVAYVNDKMPGIYTMNLNGTLQDINSDLGKVGQLGVSLNLVDEHTVRNLVKSDKSLFPQKVIDKAKDMKWNLKAINSQVTQGILQGESIPQIQKRLQNVTSMNSAAAIRSARTMCTTAENNGRLSGIKEAEEQGIVYEKQWMATHDERTRASHAELDGESVPIDEEFSNRLQYPGDPAGDPEEVYNCRCSMVRKLIGFRREDGSVSEVGDIKRYKPTYFDKPQEEQAKEAKKEQEPRLQQPEPKQEEDEKISEVIKPMTKEEPPLENAEAVIEKLVKEKDDDFKPIKDTIKFENSRKADEYFRGATYASKLGGANAARGYGVTEEKEKPATKWQNQLTYDQEVAISEYTGDNYEPINNFLRGLITKSEAEDEYYGQQSLSKAIKNIDAGIKKFNLKEPITVYRTCENEFLEQLTEGGVFHDAGYGSTSVLPIPVASGNVHLEIDVPRGKGIGAYVEGISWKEGEEFEFLLGRGADYRVEKIEYRKDDVYVKATIVGFTKD